MLMKFTVRSPFCDLNRTPEKSGGHGKEIRDPSGGSLTPMMLLMKRAAQSSTVSCCLRQRMPASMKPSMSPSKTESGLPTSKLVRRSLTI